MEIQSIDCPKCGGNIKEKIGQGKLFKCTHCGSSLVWPDKKETLVLSFGTNLCPDCGIDNEQSRKYCRNCGTNLTQTCPKCKSTFYVGDSFCPNGHEQESLEALKNYLDFIDTNLEKHGYDSIHFQGSVRAFYKPEFSLLSMTSEDFFIFKYINEALTPNKVKEISREVFRTTQIMKKSNSLFCFIVIITDNVARDVQEFIKSYHPIHNAQFEFPVIVELISDDLYYYIGMPLWGAGMYGGIREDAEQLLRYQKPHS